MGKRERGYTDADLASRRLKAQGGLDTPKTRAAIASFNKAARLSAAKELDLVALLETCQQEAMRLAKRLIDQELAAYIERTAPTHAERGHWLQLHGQWLIAEEWAMWPASCATA